MRCWPATRSRWRPPIDTLALTHLDVPARLGRWRVCGGYRLTGADTAGTSTRIAVAAGRDLAHQARLTELLFHAEPRLEDCEPIPAAVVGRTEQLLARRVDLVARGPRACDVARRRTRTTMSQ
jgi:adenylosuccinate synthase